MAGYPGLSDGHGEPYVAQAVAAWLRLVPQGRGLIVPRRQSRLGAASRLGAMAFCHAAKAWLRHG